MRKVFSHRVSQNLKPYFFLLPAYIVIGVLIAYPLVYNVYLSVHDWSLVSIAKPYIGLKNYIQILTGSIFWKVMRNSLIWTVGAVSGQFILGLILGLMLNRRFFGQGIARSLTLLPWVVPGVVAALTWTWMLQGDLGIVNHALRILGLIENNIPWLSNGSFAMISVIMANIWRGFPFWTLMILAALQQIPQEQVEAAMIDGANRFGVFRYVILPNLRPVLLVTAVLSTIWAMNNFTIIYVMTEGGPVDATRTIPLHIYETAFQSYRFGEAAALAFINLVIVSCMILAYLRVFRLEN